METRQQGSTLFSAVLVLIATLVVIQLWLLSTAVDALLGRQTDVLLPTMVGSALLFLLAAGLLWYVVSFDNRLRQWSSRDR
jgi:F0F1-type ATP synthase assembly protein I